MTVNSVKARSNGAYSPLYSQNTASAADKNNLCCKAAEKVTGIINDISDNFIKKLTSSEFNERLAELSLKSRESQSALSYLQTADQALADIRGALAEGRRIAQSIADGESADETSLDRIINDINALSETKFGNEYIFAADDTSSAGDPQQTATAVYAEQANTLTRDENGNSVLTMYNNGEPTTFTIGFNVGGEAATNIDSSIESGGGTTSLDANINRVSGLTAAQKTALKTLSSKLDTDYVPKILAGIVSALPQTIAHAGGPYKIGLNYYTENNNTLAYVASSFTTGVADGGNQPMTLQLSINVKHLSFSGSALTAESEADLLGTIAHEMVHAVMDVATSNGMTSQSDRFPHWFTEGVAEVFGGGMDRLNDYIPVDESSPITVVCPPELASNPSVQTAINDAKNAINASAGTAVKTDYSNFMSAMKSYNSTTNSLIGYSRGYVASMYLGWMANGKGAITDTGIARGIDKILSDIQGGKSLSTVIKEISGGAYTSASDFQSKMGDTASSNFMRDLITASGAKRTRVGTVTVASSGGGGYSVSYSSSVKVTTAQGSVMAGGLNKPSSAIYGANSGKAGSGFIDLIPENSQVQNTNNILEGGSTNSSSGAAPSTPGNNPSTGGGGTGGGGTGGGGTGGGGSGGGGTGGIGGGSGGGGTGGIGSGTSGSSGSASSGTGAGSGHPGGLILQIGSRSKDAVAFYLRYGNRSVSKISDVNVSAKGLGVNAVSVASSYDAQRAVGIFDEAINRVDSLRGSLGTMQSRIVSSMERSVTYTSDTSSPAASADFDESSLIDLKLILLNNPAEAIGAQANMEQDSLAEIFA